MRFTRYAWSVVAANLFVILWGALVRATGSGAGCGRHWPLCNGEMLPQDPGLTTLIELTHRLTSGIALLLVAILFWWSRGALPRGHRARTAAAWSLGFILIEALIGAGLVLLELVGDDDSLGRAAYLAAHLLNTFLLLAALALTAHWSGRPAPDRDPGSRGGAAPWLLAVGLAAILVLGMTGAIAALGDTLFPSRSLAEGLRADADPAAHYLVRLRVLHPVLAILAGIYLSGMVWAVARARPAALTSRWGRAVTLLVLLQLVVGLTNLFFLAPTPVQLAHLLVADLLWISVVIFAADAGRLDG
jgi:cytochrome c oxidase assembly protein subunit 15